MLGKIEGRRRRGQQRMRCLDCLINSMDMSLSRLRQGNTGKPGVPPPWGRKGPGTTERQSNNSLLCLWLPEARLWTPCVRLSAVPAPRGLPLQVVGRHVNERTTSELNTQRSLVESLIYKQIQGLSSRNLMATAETTTLKGSENGITKLGIVIAIS